MITKKNKQLFSLNEKKRRKNIYKTTNVSTNNFVPSIGIIMQSNVHKYEKSNKILISKTSLFVKFFAIFLKLFIYFIWI